MNLATVIGIPLGLGLLVFAFIFEGGNPGDLLLPSPIIIIFGGTFSALLVAFDLPDVLSIPKLMGIAMKMPPTKEKDLALRFVALAEKSRRDGLLSLEEDMQSLDPKEDPLLKKGLRYVIDGTDSEALRELLENDVAIFEKHRKHQAEIFDRVVVIHRQVAARLDFQIDQSMPAKQLQHVVQERDAGVDLATTGSVEVERHSDVGFTCLAVLAGAACRHGWAP